MTISLEKILKKVLLPAVMAVVLNGCGTLTYFAGSEIFGGNSQNTYVLKEIVSDKSPRCFDGRDESLHYLTLGLFKF